MLPPMYKPSFKSSGMTLLVLKNKIQIPDMLEDPMVGLAFSLEYVIGEPLSDEDRRVRK